MSNYDIYLVTPNNVDMYASEMQAAAALHARNSGAVVRRWYGGDYYVIVSKNMSDETVASIMKRWGLR